MRYYVYVIRNMDEEKKQYIGFTVDLKWRLAEYNSDDNKGYTRGRKWKLVYYEAYLSKRDARKREKQLKADGRARR